MRKYNIIVIGIIAVIFFSLYACNEDKGNNSFEFREVNDVDIKGLSRVNGKDTVFQTEVGKTLNLEPVLTFKLGENKGKHTFAWYWLDNGSDTGYELISNERNLSLTMKGIYSKVQTYKMLYEVTDVDTGVRYRRIFYLQVLSRLTTGYIALCEKDNGFDIDMLALYKDTLTQYNEVLDMMASTLPRKGEKPLRVFTYYDYYSPSVYNTDGSKYTVLIQTDKTANKIKSGDFSYDPSYNIKTFVQPGAGDFQGELNPGRLTPLLTATTTGLDTRLYMYYNGNMYMYNNYRSLYLFARPLNKIRNVDNSTFKTKPYIAGSLLNGAVLFNDDKKCFVYNALTSNMTSWTTTSENQLSVIELKDDAQGIENSLFSFVNNIEELLYMDTYNSHLGFAIIKDRVLGKYRLIEFKTEVNIVSKKFGATIDNNALIESIKFFARHPILPYLYMATDDKIYRMLVDVNGVNSVKDITNTCLTSGYKVSTFKFISYSGGGLNFSDHLTIGSYDPNGTVGANGKLEFYNCQPGTGELTLRNQPDDKPTAGGYQIPMSFTGIGKPVDVAWKAK
jgi:hypothetical protein